MPNLNETDQVLLESCMDEIRNVVGDTVSEKQLVETIMKHNFDCAKALDVILNNSTEASTTAATTSETKTQTPQSAQPMETGNHTYLAIIVLFSAIKIIKINFSITSNTLVIRRFIKFSFLFLFIYFHAFFGS